MSVCQANTYAKRLDAHFHTHFPQVSICIEQIFRYLITRNFKGTKEKEIARK